MFGRLRRLAVAIASLTLAAGAAAAPRLVPAGDIYNPPPVSSEPSHFTRVGSKVFFTASTLTTGRELWVTDGTAAGTAMVKEIVPGPVSAQFSGLTAFKGYLYFFAEKSLWRSNGTAAGTELVKQNVGAESADLYDAGTLLYITTRSPTELWVTDGTAARTLRVRALSHDIVNAVGHSGRLYFAVGFWHGAQQAWVTDGTSFGTRTVATGLACGVIGCSAPIDFFRVGNNVMVLSTPDGHSGRVDLIRTDGTDAGTVTVHVGAGRLVAATPTTAWLYDGARLMKTDGTSSGTVVVKGLYGQISGGAFVGNTAYFTLTDVSGRRRELWKSDGTSAGTVPVAALTFSSSDLGYRAAVGSRYVFRQRSDADGEELWVSDGTSSGTAMIQNIQPGAQSSSPEQLVSAGSYALFSADTPGVGRELWRTDGTPAGTTLLKNVAAEEVTGEISGTLRNAATSAPVANAIVAVYIPTHYGDRRSIASTSTAADGTYRIDKLTADNYFVAASAPGLIFQWSPGQECTSSCAKVGQPVAVLGGMATRGVDFSLRPGARFSGTVTFKGIPQWGVSVAIHDSSDRVVAVADTVAGDFITSSGLPPGTYYATARYRSGGEEEQASGVVHAGKPCPGTYSTVLTCNAAQVGTPLTGVAGQTTGPIHISLLEKPRITGRVTAATGEALAGVWVEAHTSAGTLAAVRTTGSTGAYAMTLQPGQYYLRAVKSSSSHHSQVYDRINCTATSCSPLSGRAVSVDYNRSVTGINFVLNQKTSLIRGTLTDALTGEAAIVRVELYRSDGTMVPGPPEYLSSGSFEFLVPPGTYYLKVGTRLYKDVVCASSCNVTSGTPIVVASPTSAVDLAITVPHPTRVSGTVTEEEALYEGWRYITVQWRAVADDAVLGQTGVGRSGAWQLAKPSAPAYLVVSGSGLAQAWNGKPLVLRNGTWTAPNTATVFDPAAMSADIPNLNVTLRLRPAIRGRVTDPQGIGVSGTIYVYDSAGTNVSQQATSENGSYEYRPPAAGVYFIVAAVRGQRQIYKAIACNTTPCPVTAGTPLHLDPGVRLANIDFVFPAAPPIATGISGTIYDDVTGRPLPGATVLIAQASTPSNLSAAGVSDAYGRFTVALPAGQSIIVSARGPNAAYYTRRYGDGATVLVQENVVRTGIDIRLPKIAIMSWSTRFGPVSGGTRVTLTGANFPAAATLFMHSTAASVVSATPTQIVFVTPPGQVGRVELVIYGSRADGVSASADDFTYVTPAGDINGDLRSDIVWRNASTGANDAWLMDARYTPVTRTFNAVAGDWDVQTLGDFDGDGLPDVFWRNTTTGANSVWYMRSPTPQTVTFGTMPLAWRIVGSGDFDRDGVSDLFWRNDGTGGTQIWFGSGTAFRAATSTTAKVPWQPHAIGDVNGDGRADVIWQNSTTYQVVVWYMNGVTPTSKVVGTMNAPWRVVATGDTDADGMADILWRNDHTGENSLWLMTATSFVAKALTRVAAPWKPMGMGDFTGDGRADIFWRNESSGQTSVWVMTGATLVSTILPPSRPVAFKPYLAH